jgi:hypothetical protein
VIPLSGMLQQGAPDDLPVSGTAAIRSSGAADD